VSTFLTILAGVVIYIIGQVLQEIWLYPLQQYKKLKSDISFTLAYLADKIARPIHVNDDNKDLVIQYQNAANDLLKMGCQLRGFQETIYFFHIGIPKKKKLISASKELVDLAAGIYLQDGRDTCDADGASAIDEIVEMNLQGAANVRSLLRLYSQRDAK